jgi:hypothetical protein
MTEGSSKGSDDIKSREDLQQWLIDEVRDSTKALDLRLREATQLVADYSAGKISPEEATERFHRFDQRWGEALVGATASAGVSDEAILQRIDDARLRASRVQGRLDRNVRGS